MDLLSLNDWLVSHVRLTVFCMPGATVDNENWFREVTDSEPDEISSNPKVRSSSIQGSYGGGQISLKLEGDRIDWVLANGAVELESLLSGVHFPTIGPTDEAIGLMETVAAKWLIRADLPPVTRLAFGATFLHQESEKRTGYVRLRDYVPVQIDEESSDFFYQINLRRKISATQIAGLHLNRLSKWSVTDNRLLRNATGILSQSGTIVPLRFATRIEVDINTVPGSPAVLQNERLIDIFRELVAEGKYLVSTGVRAPA